jgi:hypothetical protein
MGFAKTAFVAKIGWHLGSSTLSLLSLAKKAAARPTK